MRFLQSGALSNLVNLSRISSHSLTLYLGLTLTWSFYGQFGSRSKVILTLLLCSLRHSTSAHHDIELSSDINFIFTFRNSNATTNLFPYRTGTTIPVELSKCHRIPIILIIIRKTFGGYVPIVSICLESYLRPSLRTQFSCKLSISHPSDVCGGMLCGGGETLPFSLPGMIQRVKVGSVFLSV